MSVFKDGILIDLTVSSWSGTVRLVPEDLGIRNVSKAFRLGDKYLIPKNVIDEFKYIEGKARRVIDFPYGLKFPIAGARFIPRVNISSVIDKLNDFKSQYSLLVTGLVNNYDTYKQQMRPEYERIARIAYQRLQISDIPEDVYINKFLERINSYYPTETELQRRYDISWTVYEIGLPEADYINQEWKKQAKEKIESFIESVISELRGETIKLCQRISESIQNGKVIRSTTINTLNNFIENFKNLNFVGDKEIENTLNDLKLKYANLFNNPTQIQDDETLRNSLKTELDNIIKLAQVSDYSEVVGSYKRKLYLK